VNFGWNPLYPKGWPAEGADIGDCRIGFGETSDHCIPDRHINQVRGTVALHAKESLTMSGSELSSSARLDFDQIIDLPEVPS